MRRTTTTLSRFTTFITNWSAKGRLTAGLFFGVLILFSCEDTTGDIGIKNPSRDFQIFVKEFTIPTSTFLVDSLSTSYGNTVYDGSVTTPTPDRVLVGQKTDPTFGKTTAITYMQYWAASGIQFDPNRILNAEYVSATLTLVLDNYWDGDQISTNQQFEIHELSDSIITYRPYFNYQSTAAGGLIGTTSKVIDPGRLDQNILDNTDFLDTGAPNLENDIVDSLFFNLDDSFGRRLLAFAADTTGDRKNNYGLFSRFRRVFKGLSVVAPNAKQIIGFNATDVKSRIVLNYKVDTNKYQLIFPFRPSRQTFTGRPEYMGYSHISTDRSGTPLAALPPKYSEWQPGYTYVQAGEGIIAKLDFSEVVNFFKDIPTKSLSVAELKIESDADQRTSPAAFTLRALKYNNRFRPTSIDTVNIAYDPLKIVDYEFVFKHVIVQDYWLGPTFYAQPAGDDNKLFKLLKTSTSGPTVYTGYLTNFLQNELALDPVDFIRYWALIPQTPDLVRGTNGFYFPADKIKLKVYYAAPRASK